MSRFLKLTKIIINKNVIQHIDINKDNYLIHLMTNKTDGILIFGGGASVSHNTEVKICKTKNLIDYKTVTDWIDNGLN
jgi:putative cell wall-binding protein